MLAKQKLPLEIFGVFLIVVRTSGIACPMSCRCLPSSSANCSSLQLSELPRGGFSHIRQADFSRNFIEKLTRFAVDGLGGNGFLESIDFSWNLIATIDKDTFYEESLLEEIDLSFNRLIRINAYTFKYLERLTWLSFEGNWGFHLVDAGRFLKSDSDESLTLNLSNCTLTKIPSNSFENLMNVRELDLSNNCIAMLPETLTRLPRLTYLNVEGNPLQCSCLVNEPRWPTIQLYLSEGKNLTCASQFSCEGGYTTSPNVETYRTPVMKQSHGKIMQSSYMSHTSTVRRTLPTLTIVAALISLTAYL